MGSIMTHRQTRRRLAAIAVGSAVVTGTALATPALAQADGSSTVRVSVGARSAQANADSFATAITPDGRYVVFESDATNLVPRDTNKHRDVFVRDTKTGRTRIVSVSSRGSQANGASGSATISANGRYVAFDSEATNLAGRDTNDHQDVFRHDMITGATQRISVGRSGSSGSGGGRSPSISAAGTKIAYESWASDLVAHDTNGNTDVFVWSRVSARTVRVSVGPNGVQTDPAPIPQPPYGGERNSSSAAISGDGRYVAFTSSARNLVAGDTNGVSDIFVHDLLRHVTRRVSLRTGGAQATTGYKGTGSYAPTISANGRVLAFGSASYDLVPTNNPLHQFDSYVVNLDTGVTQLAEHTLDGGPTPGGSSASISPDGRFVVLGTGDQLVAGDTNSANDVFVRDLRTNRTVRVSVTSRGTQANGSSSGGVAADGGRVVAFNSEATNLVARDTNGAVDVFTHR
jgi:Tol biopolymer transport system component